MASYGISSTYNSITLTITPDSGYTYFRFFCRLTSDSSSVVKDTDWITDKSVTITGLALDTSYTVNVA